MEKGGVNASIVSPAFLQLLGSHGRSDILLELYYLDQPLKGMFNINGKETAHPRRALDNTESYSVFIFPHVSTTEVLDISDVQMYRTLLSVDTYLLIAQIIGCLFACTV